VVEVASVSGQPGSRGADAASDSEALQRSQATLAMLTARLASRSSPQSGGVEGAGRHRDEGGGQDSQGVGRGGAEIKEDGKSMPVPHCATHTSSNNYDSYNMSAMASESTEPHMLGDQGGKCAASSGSRARATPTIGTRSKKFRKLPIWTPCSIGRLPCPLDPNGQLPTLDPGGLPVEQFGVT
jgi:hypothetical protein